ncbi:UNVERIFIED_CONTAM: hypothetical protein Slati_4245200 [Sesamum latifolium]|uniref:Uncharacterized protein n=1 Tax=Sesamum latifolium TaxID=2727402 RepID=A0AAW2TDE1_9LAMI
MTAVERLIDFASETRRDRQTTIILYRIRRVGRSRSGVTPTEVGETESPRSVWFVGQFKQEQAPGEQTGGAAEEYWMFPMRWIA